MAKREFRFAADERGLRVIAQKLVGQVIKYWEEDGVLREGRVTAAEIKRDRYGNPFIEVDVEEVPTDGSGATA
ncbi:hypothetical protein HRbin25_00614 [bacterium HR25]|nr:hypothetical protein HRbin25_00614 [bacterium HR25]